MYEYALKTEEIPVRVKVLTERVAEAAVKSGRRPGEISIVAATKMNDTPRIKAAIAAGIRICGENRVQELREKQPEGAYEGAELQFIGRLQTNKVKYLVGNVSLIQSCDRLELIDAVSALAVKKGLRQDILLEIHTGGEESKSGFLPSGLGAALEYCASKEGIRVRGLMTVPPPAINNEENLPYFNQMNQLFIDNQCKKYDNVSMDFLSMGMSADYYTAILCGANMIRVGSTVFGPRNYGNVL